MAGNDTETAEVLRATRRLIEEARAVVPNYAAGFCGASTSEIAPLYAHTRTHLQELRFDCRAKGMAMPFRDGHLILLDSGCKRSDRTFTIRHELAHILAGEAEEMVFLTAEDTMSYSERRADLFAVADLTPTRWMDWIRKGPRPWRAITLDVVLAYRELTEGWTEARLWDRARLRVALYRQHGI